MRPLIFTLRNYLPTLFSSRKININSSLWIIKYLITKQLISFKNIEWKFEVK